MKPRRAVVLAASFLVLALTASCSWMPFAGHTSPDPVTLAHLETIQSAGTISADSCRSFVAYEQSKQASKSPMFDKKSLSDITRICKCYADADPSVPLELDACKTEVQTAISHEHDKSKK